MVKARRSVIRETQLRANTLRESNLSASTSQSAENLLRVCKPIRVLKTRFAFLRFRHVDADQSRASDGVEVTKVPALQFLNYKANSNMIERNTWEEAQ